MIKQYTENELEKLRKGLKAKKLPIYHSDTSGSWDGIGNFKFHEDQIGITVTWEIETGKSKSASFKDLCLTKELEEDRLELGLLIASILEEYANSIMHQITDPSLAQKYVQPELKMAKEWRHWSLVPAGHMLLPENF
jgi:hypothetical protein